MVGEFDNQNIKGIIPRSFDYIFEKIKQNQIENPSSKYSVNISFIQIYLETIQDLFDPSNQVKIREDPDRGVFLENCLWIKVKNTNECSSIFKKGEKNRATECTRMNAHSSRSHAILITRIDRNFCDKESQEHIMTQGYLYLVDLAGSERVTKTNARNMRLEEAKKINYSLLILGNCIQSLINPNCMHVSYRDSKLTRILQESLGGNAKTSLIVTISPSNYNNEETLSALNFGLRAMKVQNKPMINRAQDYQNICFKLQEDYDKLMEQYSKIRIEYDKVCDENEKIKNGEIYLDFQKEMIQKEIEQKNNENLENLSKISQKFEKDMRNLEKYYTEVIKNKDEENNKIMKEIDNALIKKENEMQNMKMQLNEYKSKIKSLSENNNDLIKEVDDLQHTCNDMLIEKEQLNNKINNLNLSKQNLSKNIIILNKEIETIKNIPKNNNETQTDPQLNQKLNELLFKNKISANDINNENFNKIISQLLITINTMQNDEIINNSKIKKLNESITMMRMNYEDKLNLMKKENEKLKNDLNDLLSEKKELEETLNNTKSENEKDITDLKNKITELESIIQNNNKEKNSMSELQKKYEKQITDIKNNNKILNMNKQTSDNELKKLKDHISNIEKNINKNYAILKADNNYLNLLKKENKKVENLIDNELTNINNNLDSTLNKAKVLGNKIQTLIEDNSNSYHSISYNSSTTSLNNNDINETINKINEFNVENKNMQLNNMSLLCKIYYKYLDLYKKYKSYLIDNEKNNKLEKEKNLRDENKLKNNIISITSDNLDKFIPMVYGNNTKDLKQELKDLKLKAANITCFDVLKTSLDILSKLLFRISSYKDEKELEIENLTGKIIYLLSELDNYKKCLIFNSTTNIDNNKNNRNDIKLLNNQISLKDQEISRLNKEIEYHLLKIKELKCENNIYKNQNTNKINSKIKDDLKNNIPEKEDFNFRNNNVINYKLINENKTPFREFDKNNINDKNEMNESYEIEDQTNEELENNLAKYQNDIDKINEQLRELNKKEIENKNKNLKFYNSKKEEDNNNHNNIHYNS